MGAYTSAILYRHGPPPVVTTDSLADFVEGLDGLNLLEDEDVLSVDLKFGPAIDQDEEPTSRYVEDPPGMFKITPIAWDASLTHHPIGRVAEWLRAPMEVKGFPFRDEVNRRIYRCTMMFGTVCEDILGIVTRQPSEENDTPLCLDCLMFHIAPTTASDPETATEEEFFVGWMDVSISGYGYLYPWTYEETLTRIKKSESLRRLADLCRSCWPVPPEPPSPGLMANRKAMGKLWGGDDYDAPRDWRWVIQESY